ncbi:hypothetical protein EDB80DRAFT_684892 [Ilyonectria destructans]|nr:hypothetical protein EDB80DRAFT_684892 [Ilyonectria destructans]
MAGAATNWGYQPDGYNANDAPYTYQGTKIHHSDMTGANLLKDNPTYFQSDLALTGSCVVDALAVAVAYLQSVVKYDTIPSPPSRLFMYYNGRALGLMGDSKGGQVVWPNGIADSGVTIRNAIQGINSFGLVSETQYPWEVQDFPRLGSVTVGINNTPDASIYAEASNTPAFNSYRLDSPPSAETKNAETPTDFKAESQITLLHIRECLTEGMPVIFAFHFYWPTFETTPPATGDDGYPTIAMIPAKRAAVGPDPVKNYQISVGLVVGFEHEKNRLLVKSMLNNGTPYFWMSYKWILDAKATEGFWMMRAPSSMAASHAVIETPSPSALSQQVAAIVGLPCSPSDAAPNSTIATVSRNNIGSHGDCTDVFWKSSWISTSRSYYYTEKGSWQFTSASVGCLMEAVAAVSPAPDVMDLFWISSDGSVNHAQTLGTTLANEPSSGVPAIWEIATEVAPAGSADTSAGLAAASQVTSGYYPGGPGSVQVYWIGPDGSVECANNMANNTTTTT